MGFEFYAAKLVDGRVVVLNPTAIAAVEVSAGWEQRGARCTCSRSPLYGDHTPDCDLSARVEYSRPAIRMVDGTVYVLEAIPDVAPTDQALACAKALILAERVQAVK